LLHHFFLLKGKAEDAQDPALCNAWVFLAEKKAAVWLEAPKFVLQMTQHTPYGNQNTKTCGFV
jgi:hypothetical protein